MCFAEMFAFIAKHRPASFPLLVFLSIAFENPPIIFELFFELSYLCKCLYNSQFYNIFNDVIAVNVGC